MLDKRLKTIFDMVDKGMIVADIGTDHAFLPIELIKKNKAEFVYACDVRENPLKIASKNIQDNNLNDKIHTILTDGLKDVPSNVNCIVIAGMGYHTCKSILENSFEKLKRYKEIIVQVNNDVDLFRRWISDNHFSIIDEKIVCVKHFYTIIKINMDYNESYNEDEILFGPILLKENSKEFKEYLKYRLNKLNNILSKIKDEKKIEELNVLICKIKGILKKGAS